MHVRRDSNDSPFFSRLLRRLPASESSLSVPCSFFDESRLSQLSCRLSEVAAPIAVGLKSGVFFADVIGLPYCFGGVKFLLSTGVARLTLAKPELTAVNPPPPPPELMAVNPPEVGATSGVAVSTSCLSPLAPMLACKASLACRAGESPRRLDGVATFERFTGLGAGLGVKGPPYSYSSCW